MLFVGGRENYLRGGVVFIVYNTIDINLLNPETPTLILPPTDRWHYNQFPAMPVEGGIDSRPVCTILNFLVFCARNLGQIL